MKIKTLVAAVAGFAALVTMASVRAAEIKVLASNGVKEALHELAPAFERETGHKLVIGFGLAAALKRQIEAGEASTSPYSPPPGSTTSRSRARWTRALAPPSRRVGRGHRNQERRAASRHPHAGSAQAHAPLSEIHHLGERRPERHLLAGMLERIGIAEQMKPKIVPAASGVEVGKLVAGGQVQLGVILVNELMAAPGVEVLGPLPPELQNYTVFHAGVGVGSKDSSAAKALIKFLTTPAAGAVFKAKGRSPVKLGAPTRSHAKHVQAALSLQTRVFYTSHLSEISMRTEMQKVRQELFK